MNCKTHTSVALGISTMTRICLQSLWVVVAGCAMAYGQSQVQVEIQSKLDQWHRDASFPGATLGVVMADGTVLSFATGLADRELSISMKPEDRMLAGSVGKTFASATALQWIAEGRLDLDDKIDRYLEDQPWFSRLPNARTITIRQLMNHTSGLVRYEFKEQFTKDLTANSTKTWKPEELLAYLFDEKAPFESGKGWDYSDTNYIVLGMILEKIGNEPFYDQAQKRLLTPLRLNNTVPQKDPKIESLIPGYAGPDNPFGGQDKMLQEGRLIINPQFEWTGGGYASTSTDLARWCKLYFEGQAFDPKLLPQVLDGTDAPMLGRGAQYGLGAILRNTSSGKSYGHSGFFPGYMTEMMYFPEHQISVAVQVNCSVPKDLGRPLSRILMESIEILTRQEESSR